MANPGFLQDKLDIKMLELYLLARAVGPLDPDLLAELALSHEGVSYFDFAEATAELVERGNIVLEKEGYVITEKGRVNAAACESSLAYSVRCHSDEALAPINEVLRRKALVKGEKVERPDGSITARMLLNDDNGNLLTLELLCPSTEQADKLIAAFQEKPEKLYNTILMALSGEREGKD